MAFKRYVRERSERTGLIDDLRDAIVGGSSRRGKDVVDGGPGVCLGFFLSLGNVAYGSGDSDVFEYFLGSLFDVAEAGPEGVDCAGLVERVRGYGFRSVRDFDLAMFGAVVEVVAGRVFSMRDVVEIGGWLGFLRDLGLRSAEAGFDGGVLAVVDVFRLLGVHFDGEGLGVSSMSLKSHVVGLVHYLGGVGDDRLRGRVISLVEGVLAPSPGPGEAPLDGGVGSSPVV
jgi:hypothetical protein